MHDLQQATEQATPLAGVCLDLAKAFDTVSPRQALEVFRRLGAPPGLVNLLQQFYDAHCKWVEWQGSVAGEPIRPTRGLLQGDPAAPVLLVALMQ
eukprot:4320141-Alexandrium_andersonii.AAC.1